MSIYLGIWNSGSVETCGSGRKREITADCAGCVNRIPEIGNCFFRLEYRQLLECAEFLRRTGFAIDRTVSILEEHYEKEDENIPSEKVETMLNELERVFSREFSGVECVEKLKPLYFLAKTVMNLGSSMQIF